MPESQEFKSVRTLAGNEAARDGSAGDGANAAESRMTMALDRLETALKHTLAEYAALKRDHQKLHQDYHALRKRTESVGEQLDATISRLKDIIADGNIIRADANATAEEIGREDEWVKSPSK